MASTYVNDLRLEEMATGDQSGTWGDTTNTNLELIAEAFSYATQDCFTTDADATTTIADGATDPARSFYFKVTSSATLTATRALTLAPDTVSKLWIIENATTGSQDITIKQGSGTSVTIENGATSVVYSDGGGATANVADAFADLQISGGDFLVDSPTFYVDSSNNRVGIGTTSPTNLLDVENSSGNAAIDIISGTADLARLNLGDTDATFRGGLAYNNSNDSMAFRANGSDQMTLTSTGLGIGTTSPVSRLTTSIAAGGAGSSNNQIAMTHSGASTSYHIKTIRASANDEPVGLAFVENATERMRIDSSGNVGIGTTSPEAILEVESANATGDQVRFGTSSSDSAGNFKLSMQTNSANRVEFLATRQSSTGGSLDIYTRAVGGTLTNALTIDVSQNVGIGTSSPTSKLHVDAGSYPGYAVDFVQGGTSGGSNTLRLLSSSGTANLIIGRASATTQFYIDGAGNYFFNGSNQSDLNKKENITDITDNALELITQLQPKKYNYIGSDVNKAGFIAQEMEQVIPRLVTGNEFDPTVSDDVTTNPTGKGIDYMGYTAYLTKAIQEQQVLIEQLQAEVALLKGE